MYEHSKLHRRIIHLNNRELAIFGGVIVGFIIGCYGVLFGDFVNIVVFGTFYKNSLLLKITTIVLCAGTFGNLFSYVGTFLDILTNHKTIFDLIRKYST